MDRVGASTPSPVYSQEIATSREIAGPKEIVRQLAAAATSGRHDEWAPIAKTWEQLKSIIWHATRGEKDAIESTLSAALPLPAYRSLDAQLLDDVVHAVLDPDCRVSPEQYLAGKAYEHLVLPELKLLEKGEIEPSSRTFNSIFPSLAAGTYDYGTLGRTLLWDGASQMFVGIRFKERSDTLRQVIFSSPSPKQGEKELKHMGEFYLLVDGLNLDETIYPQAKSPPA
jgi:hypothetical protein